MISFPNTQQPTFVNNCCRFYLHIVADSKPSAGRWVVIQTDSVWRCSTSSPCLQLACPNNSPSWYHSPITCRHVHVIWVIGEFSRGLSAQTCHFLRKVNPSILERSFSIRAVGLGSTNMVLFSHHRDRFKLFQTSSRPLPKRFLGADQRRLPPRMLCNNHQPSASLTRIAILAYTTPRTFFPLHPITRT